jgi:iron complex outermembrane receptor protein
MERQGRGGAGWRQAMWCGASAIAILLASGGAGAMAQSAPPLLVAQAAQSFEFDIPAQPLSAALSTFSRVTGLQTSVAAEALQGRQSQLVRGRLTAEEALTRLLSGTGLVHRFADTGTITLVDAPRTGEPTQLPAVTVEAEREVESAKGPVPGIVAKRNITATKTDTPLIETPQAITVITRERMEDLGANNLATALRYTPGVTGEAFGLDNRGGGLNIRGFSATDSLFRDGLRVRNTPFVNTPIDTYSAERIEVLRGPASVLYGQAEPGGIINIVSKRPTATPLYEVELGAGNFDRYEGKFDLSGPVDKEGKLLYRLTGLSRNANTQVDFVGEDRIFFAPALTWRPSEDTSLTFLSHYQEDRMGWAIQFYPAQGTVLPNRNGSIRPSRFTGEPAFDEYNLVQYSVGYEFEHRFNEAWTVRQNAKFNHLDNQQHGVFGNGLDPTDPTESILNRYGDEGDSRLNSFLVDNQVQSKFATGAFAHTLLFGFDYQRHIFKDIGFSWDVDTTVPFNIYNPVYGAAISNPQIYQNTKVTQDQMGLYVQDQIKLWDRWSLLIGGRYDWVETDTDDRLAQTSTTQKDHDFTGRVGLVYLSEVGLAPYASYSESFVPSLGTNVDGRAFVPVTGQQYEIGIKYQPPGWNSFMTVSAFDLRRQNVLTPDPADPVNSQVQTGEVRTRGIEVEAVAQPFPGLKLIAAYAYLNTEITKSNVEGEQGQRPIGVPEHAASLWADYTVQSGTLAGFGGGSGVRYVGSTFGDTAPNTLKVPDYTLIDAALHYDLGNFRFQLNGNNLFDKEHIVACQNVNGCFFGASRTVIGTVRYRW